MSIPQNPDTVVLQNQWYPKGLTEREVWDHYQKLKPRILVEAADQPVAVFLFTAPNEYVVKRNLMGHPIILHERNYDQLVTGRTVSLSVMNRPMSDFWCIDIDRGEEISDTVLIQAIRDLLNSSLAKMNLIRGYRVITTGSGIHLYFNLKKTLDLASSKRIIASMLRSELEDNYTIGKKQEVRRGINLDLSTMDPGGFRQVPYALCRNGLQSFDITLTWRNYDRRKYVL